MKISETPLFTGSEFPATGKVLATLPINDTEFRVHRVDQDLVGQGPQGPPGPAGPSVMFSQTSTVLVTNTIAETSLLGSGVGSKTIAANTFVVGKSINFDLRGFVITGVNREGTLRVKIGGVTFPMLSVVRWSSTTDSAWNINLKITCRVVGASGVLLSGGHLLQTGNDSGSQIAAFGWASAIPANTTINNIVDVTWQWVSAELDNQVHCTIAEISLITLPS